MDDQHGRTRRKSSVTDGGRPAGSVGTPGSGGGQSSSTAGQSGGASVGGSQPTATDGTGTGASPESAGAPTQRQQQRQEPDPQVSSRPKVVPDKEPGGRLRATRTRRITFESLTAKGAEKLAVFVTSLVVLRYGQRYKPTAGDIENMGETLVDSLEPYPIISGMIARWCAPALFAGSIILYVGRCRELGTVPEPHVGMYIPPPPPATRAGIATPPPPPPPPPTPPIQQPNATDIQHSNGHVRYDSVVAAAPLISTGMDN